MLTTSLMILIPWTTETTMHVPIESSESTSNNPRLLETTNAIDDFLDDDFIEMIAATADEVDTADTARFEQLGSPSLETTDHDDAVANTTAATSMTLSSRTVGEQDSECS